MVHKKKRAASHSHRFIPLVELLEDRRLMTAGTLLQGYAYKDLNGNGHFDSGEGLSNAGITLYAADKASVLGHATSDSHGFYIFQDNNGTILNNNLTQGTYYLVEISAPLGFQNASVDFNDYLDTPTADSIGSHSAIRVTIFDPNNWNNYAEGFGAGRDGVRVTLAGPDGFDLTGWVGQLPIQVQNGSFSNPASPPPFLISYCADLFGDVNPPQTFAVVPQSALAALNNGGQVAYLFNHYGSSNPLGGPAGIANDDDHAEALQDAIWALIYGSNFTAHPSNSNVAADYTTYLNEAGGKSESAIYLAPVNVGQGMLATESLNFANTVIPFIKQTPLIITSPNPTSVTLGNSPTTLTDAVSISGGNHPAGTVTFTLFAPGNPVAVDTEIVPVTDDGTYATPTGYLLPAVGAVVGTYQWDAVYSGDDNNNLVRENNNVGEQVVVNKAQPKLVTVGSFSAGNVVGTAIPQDQATLSGGCNISGGSITFNLQAQTPRLWIRRRCRSMLALPPTTRPTSSSRTRSGPTPGQQATAATC